MPIHFLKIIIYINKILLNSSVIYVLNNRKICCINVNIVLFVLIVGMIIKILIIEINV